MKRTLDLAGSVIGLVVFAIPMAVVAALIRLTLGSPVIYRQPRPGLHGRTFDIYKFRTMRDTTDAAGNPLPNRLRITALGRFLRRTSLDELPELINVLRGEMSLVGPRPLRVEYLERYTPEQARRHDVLPGITGWAQINGRNTLNWDERLALDIWYVDHASVWLDLKILMQTLFSLVRGMLTSAPTAWMCRNSWERHVGIDSAPLTGVKEMTTVEQEIRTFLAENFSLGGDINRLPGNRSLTERGIHRLGRNRRGAHVPRDAVRHPDQRRRDGSREHRHDRQHGAVRRDEARRRRGPVRAAGA